MINEQRVQRIKNGIYAFIVLLFLLPLIATIVLLAIVIGRMDALNDQLKSTQISYAQQQQVAEQSHSDSSRTDSGYVLNPQEQAAENDDEQGEATSPSQPDQEPTDPGREESSSSAPDSVSQDDQDIELSESEPEVSQSPASSAASASSQGEQLEEPARESDELPFTGSRRYSVNSYSPATHHNLYFDTIPLPAQQESKTLYLSFDNASDAYSEDILSVLDRYGVKATFFVWGDGTDAFYRKIVDSGHSIGIQSSFRAFAYGELPIISQLFLDDFSVLFDRIADVTGASTRLYRLPNVQGQSAILDGLKRELDGRGFLNVCAQDTTVLASSDKEAFVNGLRAGIADAGQIAVSLRDGTEKTTVEALDLFLSECLAEGYQFACFEQ